MSQVYSPNASAVKAIEANLTVNAENNIAVKGGKVISRAVASSLVTVTAAIETVAYAILAMITSPTALFEKTRAPFDFAKSHTIVAANATKDAFRSIVGYNTKGEQTTTVPTLKSVKERARELFAKALHTVKNPEQKHVVGTIVLVSAVASFFYGKAAASAIYTGGANLLGRISLPSKPSWLKMPSIGMPSFSMPSMPNLPSASSLPLVGHFFAKA